jgi:superfamily II DNA or RNA helicase
LRTEGFLIRKTDLNAAFGDRVGEFYASLTKRYDPKIGAAKIVSVYRNIRDKGGEVFISLPRGIRSAIAEHFNILVAFPPVRRITQPIAQEEFLYESQKVLLEATTSALVNNPAQVGSAVLYLRAGWGKSFIAAAIIRRLCVKTLYIVPTIALAAQISTDMKSVLTPPIEGEKSALIASVMDFSPEKNDICIAVINSAVKAAEDNPRFFSNFDLVIFDEVHQYCTEKRMSVFWCAAKARWNLGMTATPNDRRDEFDFIFQKHLSPIIDAAKVPGFEYPENSFSCCVQVVNYYGPENLTQNLTHDATGEIFVHFMYEQMARDAFRNRFILEKCDELLKDKHNVFIFAEERNHLELLYSRFCKKHPEIPCGYFVGGISDTERKDIIENARVIFATYSYGGTGISVVRMTAEIFVSPRYSAMKQIVPRIMRKGSDETKKRVIVDIVDSKTCLKHQYFKRRTAYEYYSCEYRYSVIHAPAVGEIELAEGATPPVELAQCARTEGEPGEAARSPRNVA